MEESVGEEALLGAYIPGVRIWGPVPRAQAVGAGALAAASSVLIAPRMAPARLYERLTALVPDEVLPKVRLNKGKRDIRVASREKLRLRGGGDAFGTPPGPPSPTYSPPPDSPEAEYPAAFVQDYHPLQVSRS